HAQRESIEDQPGDDPAERAAFGRADGVAAHGEEQRQQCEDRPAEEAEDEPRVDDLDVDAAHDLHERRVGGPGQPAHDREREGGEDPRHHAHRERGQQERHRGPGRHQSLASSVDPARSDSRARSTASGPRSMPNQLTGSAGSAVRLGQRFGSITWTTDEASRSMPTLVGWKGAGSFRPWMSGPSAWDTGAHSGVSTGRATEKPYFSAPAISTSLSWRLRSA